MTSGGKRRGAGRPAGTGIERRVLTVRLPVDVHAAMTNTQLPDESINEYVTAAVETEAQRRRDEG